MPDSEGWGPTSAGNFIVTFVPLFVWVAALVFAAIASLRAEAVTFDVIVEKLLRYLFVFPLGLQGLWAFFCHVFLPQQTAGSIGWAPSPFQYELGVANLGLAVASFYAAFSSFRARTAVVAVAACFLVGAGIGHLEDMIQDRNFAAGNAGPIMITDFLTPIAIIALLLLQPKARPEPEPPLRRITDELARARAELEKSLQGPGL